MKLSRKICDCAQSPIRKFYPYAVAAQQRGIRIHQLNIGQPDIQTPPAFFEAIEAGRRDVLAYAESPARSTTTSPARITASALTRRPTRPLSASISCATPCNRTSAAPSWKSWAATPVIWRCAAACERSGFQKGDQREKITENCTTYHAGDRVCYAGGRFAVSVFYR